MKKDYTKLKKIFSDDAEMLRILDAQEQVEIFSQENNSLKDIVSKQGEDQKDILKEILKDKMMSDIQAKNVKIEFLKGEPPSEEELRALVETYIPKVRDGIDGEDGKDGYTPLKNKDYFDGMDGEAPTRDELLSLIVPLIPTVKDGKDGISPTIDEEELAKELIKIIRKKRLLSSDDISGLQGFSKDGINYRFEELMHGGGGTGGGSITYSVDLSSQCNGSNKVFTVPTNTNFIQLTGTDAPIVYKYVTDYTGSGTTTLTMTAAVNAPSAGATLILMYIV